MTYIDDQYATQQMVPAPRPRYRSTSPVIPHSSNYTAQAVAPAPMVPTQENWGLRQNQKKQYVENEARFKQDAANRYWAKQQTAQFSSPADGPPPPTQYTPYGGGDGSWKNNPTTAYIPQPRQAPQPQQQGTGPDMAGFRNYRERTGDRSATPRQWTEEIAPRYAKSDADFNERNTPPAPVMSLDEARRRSATNVASTEAAMSRFPANRPGGPAPVPPAGQPNTIPSPSTPPPAGAPSAGGNFVPTGSPNYRPGINGGLQGVGDGHLPDSNKVQGEAMDAMGKQMGIPRGNVVINGQDYGPRNDAEYAGLLRSEGQRRYIASGDYKNEPGYDKVSGELDSATKATAAGIPIPQYLRQQQEDALPPEERDLAAMSPQDRAKYRQGQAKIDETKRNDAAKNDTAQKAIDMRGYAEFGKNVANIARAGITSFTNWLNTNIKADVARDTNKSKETIADKGNATKTAIAQGHDDVRQNGIDTRSDDNAEKRKQWADNNKHKIALQIEKAMVALAAQMRKEGKDEQTIAKAVNFHRNTMLLSGGLGDWVIGDDGKPAPVGQTASPAQPTLPPGAVQNPDGTITHDGIVYRKKAG